MKRFALSVLLLIFLWICPEGFGDELPLQNQSESDLRTFTPNDSESLGNSHQLKRSFRYRLVRGDTIGEVLYSLEISPLWGERGNVQSVVQFNPGKTQSNGDYVQAGTVIHIPMNKLKEEMRFLVREDGFIDFDRSSSEDVVEAEPEFKAETESTETSHRVSDLGHRSEPKLDALLIEKEGHQKEYKIPQWEPSFVERQSKTERDYFLFTDLGVSVRDYKQGSDTDIDLTNLEVGLSYRNVIAPPRWHLDVTFRGTLVNLSNSQSNVDVRFFDIDTRIGYAFPFVREPWRFTLMAGAYFTTMLVTDSRFGYNPSLYPQLFPRLRRVFPSGDLVSLYAKFVSTGGSVVSLDSERAWSLGLEWVHPMGWFSPLIIGAEFNSLKFLSRPGKKEIDSSGYIFSLGVAF